MNNRKIVILDAFSTLHVGNGILLDQSLAIINKLFTPKDICILSLDPDTVKLSKKRVYADIFADFPRSSGRLKKILWAIKFFFLILYWLSKYSQQTLPQSKFYTKKTSDFVNVINYGDVFISISGETINSTFFPRMIMRCIIMWILGHKGKNVIIFPQSIGPLTKKYHKTLVKFFLRNLTLAYARDYKSFEMAKELVGEGRALLSPDVGVYSGASYPEFRKIIKKKDANKQLRKLLIGITVSRPPNELNISKSLNDDIGKVLCNFFEGQNIEFLLLPSNFSKNGLSEDYSECLGLLELLKHSNFEANILPNQTIEPHNYARHLKDVDFFLSTRMHVSILSTSLGIPTIAVNTQEKINGYMSLIKMDEYVISPNVLEKQLPKLLMDLIDLELREKCSKALKDQNEQKSKELIHSVSKAG